MDHDDRVAKWLNSARQHALEVSNRDHIKADRNERVGMFLTSLRSQRHDSCFIPKLVDKRLWHDIAVLSPSIENTDAGRTYGSENIMRWVRLSHTFTNEANSMQEEMQATIKELSADIAGCRLNNRQADYINVEAEKVSDKLAEIFDDE